MATTELAGPRGGEAKAEERAGAGVRLRLGLVWPTVMVAAYWLVVEGGHRAELAMFPRFISRVIATAVLLLFFLIWGLTRRHFTFRQRLAGLGIVLGTMVAAGLAADPSVGVSGMALSGLPIVVTLATAWLWVTRKRGAGLELGGVAVASLLVFGTFSLLRWEGLDGRQRSQLAWRWTPTAEAAFLESLETKREEDAGPSVAEVRVGEGDWASFRGGERESVVSGVKLGDWSTPPKRLWERRVGPGWGSVIAVGDVLITQEQRGEKEAVVCYRAADGEEVWAHTSEGRFEEALSGTGPRGTPSAAGDRVVAYGATGRLVCLDASTGREVWSKDLVKEAGAKVPQWGSSTSPLILDGLVVVFAGGTEGRGLLAFDLASGAPAWQSPGGTVSYSSPQAMAVATEPQIVMQDEQALYGVSIADGRRLWSHASPSAGSFQPMIQPHLVSDDRLIVGWGNGILSLRVGRDGEKWTVTEEWESNRLKPGFNDFVVYEGHLYGLDDGILCCVSAADGKRVWKGGRYGHGQLLLLPDAGEVLVMGEQGEVARVAATPEGHRETGRFQAIAGKTWNHPVIAHGRLVVRNGEVMAGFEL